MTEQNLNIKNPKEIPVLFSTPMVQAILDGRKTETRRVVKGGFNPQEMEHTHCFEYEDRTLGLQAFFKDARGEWGIKCPYGNVGDVLWVRESSQEMTDGSVLLSTNLPFVYKADWAEGGRGKMSHGGKWKPSIHMPKVAARIWLEVESISVERLQNITEDRAKAEGVEPLIFLGEDCYKFYMNPTPKNTRPAVKAAKDSFYSLWTSINGDDSWAANPWVWVIKFKVLSTSGKPATL